MGEIQLTAGNVGNGLVANGRLLNITDYSALYTLLGTRFGGDGIQTFALPNLTSLAPNGLTYTICVDGVYPLRE
jgi:microcystin-dependent protein